MPMYVISFGEWSIASGDFFIRERCYPRGKWSPFCRISKRYGTMREALAQYIAYRLPLA